VRPEILGKLKEFIDVIGSRTRPPLNQYQRHYSFHADIVTQHIGKLFKASGYEQNLGPLYRAVSVTLGQGT
jgi:hypothetical protein